MISTVIELSAVTTLELGPKFGLTTAAEGVSHVGKLLALTSDVSRIVIVNTFWTWG